MKTKQISKSYRASSKGTKVPAAYKGSRAIGADTRLTPLMAIDLTTSWRYDNCRNVWQSVRGTVDDMYRVEDAVEDGL
jgi:hypothetical protein